jgi:hypothetical protein
MLLICHDPDRHEEAEALAEANAPWQEEYRARGVWLQGEALRPPAEATTVRVREGRIVLSDGPFAETKEAIAGFDVIEAESLDEAIEVAAAHRLAALGAIEVRPFWQ